MPGNASRSPKFIKAASEADLQLEMLRMQLSKAKEFRYITIYRTPEGEVVAWYYDVNSIREVIDGQSG